jgi:hypothetical protein
MLPTACAVRIADDALRNTWKLGVLTELAYVVERELGVALRLDECYGLIDWY